MDNLGLAIESLLDVKERIVTARLSSVAYQLRPKSPKGVAGMLRNGGRFAPEWVAGIGRNQWPEWSGIRIWGLNQ